MSLWISRVFILLKKIRIHLKKLFENLKLNRERTLTNKKFLDEWKRSWCGDTAVILAIPWHFNEALVTPWSAPRVLHDPVVSRSAKLVLFVAIAHSQHTVIESCRATEVRVVDSMRVELERDVWGIDGNTDGTHAAKGLLQCVFVLWLYIHERGDCSADVWWVESALSIFSFILDNKKRLKSLHKNKEY